MRVLQRLPFHTRQPLALGAIGLSAALAVGWGLLPSTQKQGAVDWFADVCSSVSRPMFMSAPAPAGSSEASRPVTSSKILSCEPLPHVPGKSITTQLVDFPPLAHTPAHRHPGSVSVVVLEGTVRSQIAGSPAANYGKSQTFFEPPGALHLFAENPDPAVHAKIMAVYVTEENCGPLLTFEK
ncbi:cupin domain-containing protein [Ottowia sp. VDI28]|uniref:cupin domain-containing protein n=1 Tax=Ottowia sp. VDI28 TaxID=3133968 RepID=UPI003C2EA2A5